MIGRLGRWGRTTVLVGAIVGGSVITACSGGGTGNSGVASSPIGTPSSTTASSTPSTASSLPPTASSTPFTTTGSLSSASSLPSVTALPGTVAPGTVVVLDPGHNGANGSHGGEINRLVDAGGFQKACNTTGTADGGLTESSVNLDLARLVRDRLRAAGVDVILTRDGSDGWGPCIDERGQIAARAGADALVSLHADGAAAAAHGFHVIHPTTIAGYTDATAGPSTVLATLLRDTLVADGFTPATYVGSGDGLVARGDLGTLNRAGVPAAMVEIGNMHNAADLAVMASPDGKARLADALAAGILAYVR